MEDADTSRRGLSDGKSIEDRSANGTFGIVSITKGSGCLLDVEGTTTFAIRTGDSLAHFYHQILIDISLTVNEDLANSHAEYLTEHMLGEDSGNGRQDLREMLSNDIEKPVRQQELVTYFQ